MMDAPALAAWLEARLTSERGRGDARGLLEAGVEAILDRPLGEVLPEAAFARAVDDVATEARLCDLARCILRLAVAPGVEELKGDQEPVGRWLDAEARARLEALVAREGIVDESFIDVVFSQAATEELFAETLFRALQDFSESVPAVVQSLTPASLGKIASRLQGAAGGVRDRMREEIQRRLEPEIRRFVQAATRRLLDGAAGFVKSGLDREGSMEARKNLLRHALDRPTSTYLQHLDPEARADVEAVLVSVARNEEARAELRARLLAIHRRLLERFGTRSVRAVLAAHEVELDLDYDAWLDALWPAAEAALRSPGARRVLESLASDLLEALDAS